MDLRKHLSALLFAFVLGGWSATAVAEQPLGAHTPANSDTTKQVSPKPQPPGAINKAEPTESKIREPVPWKASYRKVSLVEKLLTVGYLGGAAAITLTGDVESAPNWIGPVGPDSAVHNALALSTVDGINMAAGASDILLIAIHAAVLGEAAYVYWGRQSPEAGAEMFWMSANAMSLALFLNTISKYTFKRERPGFQECFDNDDPACPQEEIGSFYSGHASAAFAAAGVMCANETYLPIYSNSWTNLIPCITTTAAATSVAVLRIVANKHYFTDVLVGGLMGASIGFLYPVLGNYTTFGIADTDVSVVPYGDQGSAGLSFSGGW